MSFGTSPGGTTVGSAQYVVSLDTQAMLQGLAQLQQTTQQSSQQVVAALAQISGEEKAIEGSSASMASAVAADLGVMETAMSRVGAASAEAGKQFGELKNVALEFLGFQAITDVLEKVSEQFKETVTETQSFGFEVQQLQRVMGVSTQTASEFAAVFDRYDISGQQAVRSLTQFSRAIEGLDQDQTKVSQGAVTGQQALRDLGIQLEDVGGRAKTTDEIFLEVLDALKAQGEGFKTTTDAQALFSRSYQDLLPIISLGSAGFRGLAEEAKAYGLVLTAENAPQVNEFIESQRDLNDAMAGLRLTIGTELAPVLTDVFKQLSQFEKDYHGDIGNAFHEMGNDAKAIGLAFKDWTGYLQDDLDFLDRFAKSGVTVHNAIEDMLSALRDTANSDVMRVLVDLASGNVVDLASQAIPAFQQRQTERAQAAEDVAVESPAAESPETDPRATQQRQVNNASLEKTIEDNLKARASAVKDEAQTEIDSLHQQEQAAQQTYQNQLHAYQIQKDEQTRANDTWHRDALARLQEEEDATKKSYDAQIAAAQDAKDKQTKAAADEHTATLAQIADEVKAAQDASKDRVSTLEEQRDAEFKNIDAIKQAQLDALQVQQQAVQDTRLQQDRALQDARQQEDRDAQTAHQAEIERLKSEHDAAVQRYADERAEIEKTKTAALEAIQAETDARSGQHDATLQHLKDEQAAAQAQHDQIRQNLQDEQQAAQDAHDQRVRQLQDEQTAEQNASQAAQDALKAQEDAETQQHNQRLADIDAESKAQQAALQQQLAALNQSQQTDTFAAQQAKLQQAVAQAQTGVQIAQEIAQNTGDPNTTLAAQKALADAQAALDKANADRAVQLQKDTIQQEEQALQDQTDTKKQAENDQYQAEKDRITKEIADEQARLKAVKDSIAQQITAANDQLAVVKSDLAQQQQANDAALKARLAGIQQETEAENNAFKAFQAAEANKRKEVEATATTATATVQGESDAEAKAYTASTKTVDARYADEQQRVADTRKVQDRAITDNRTQEDRDSAAHKQAVQDQAQHDHDQIDTLYNNPKTGLIQIEKNALAETLADLATRKTNADATYQDEQTQIAATFTDKDTGLIPKLQAALKEQTDDYASRRTDVNNTYQNEKDRIFETFDRDTGDPATSGLIPNLTNAYNQTKANLAQQVAEWQKWQQDVSKEIQTTIDNLQKLIDKVNQLNNLGKNPVREGPQPVEGEAQGNVPGETSDQAAADRAAQAGGRGLYGGAPLSVAQFGPGSATLRTEFGNSNVDAMCGPIAAEALARLAGNPQQMADILAWAKANGYWDPNVGIENAGFGAIAQHFGVQTSIHGDKQSAIDAIAAGEPAVFNTANHYMLAQGYDASSGLFDLGYTGETVYGQRYMTFEQLSARGGGFRNVYVADTTSLFGGSAAPAGTSSTVSVPSLGINFQITAPVRLEDVAGPIQATGDVLNGTVADWVSQALAATGKPASWLNDLMLLVAAESGQRNADGSVVLGTGDPRARNPQDVNGQNAQGLMQTLPSTFIANVPPGLPKDIANPVSNAAAAIEYIASRYGNPENTPYWTLHSGSFSTTNVQGYAAGGIIPEPTALLSLRTLQPYAIAGEVGPERVAPLSGAGATARQAVESVVHNYYGVAPESIVRDMQNAQRRERLLRGR